MDQEMFWVGNYQNKLNIFSFQPKVKNAIGGNVVRFLFLIQAQHTT